MTRYEVRFQTPYNSQEWRSQFFNTLNEAESMVRFYLSCGSKSYIAWNKMTYKELINQLQELNEEQLNQLQELNEEQLNQVVKGTDEYYQLKGVLRLLMNSLIHRKVPKEW